MPVGKRDATTDERFFMTHLSSIAMLTGGDEWRARRDLQLAIAREGKISMQQAHTIRAFVAKYFLKRWPKRARTFAESSIGEFPFVKQKERV